MLTSLRLVNHLIFYQNRSAQGKVSLGLWSGSLHTYIMLTMIVDLVPNLEMNKVTSLHPKVTSQGVEPLHDVITQMQ